MLFLKFCSIFQFFILPLSLHFFHSVDSNVLNSKDDDKILELLRPLKYNKNCKEFCRSITCQPVKECSDGVIMKHETYCGCCEACVKFLNISENCKSLIKGPLAFGAQSRCKIGTTCENGKCKLNPEEESCLLHQDIRKKHSESGNYMSDIWIPQCDKEGNYAAEQKKISKSVCVNKSGDKIFGNPDDLLDNTCACARYIQHKIKEDPVLFYLMPHEHCFPSGNFDTLQCIGNLCYCAEADTGDIKSELVRIDHLHKLNCSEENIYTEDYLKDCEKELQRTMRLAYDFKKKGVDIYGIHKVNCDPDGTFSPKQTISDRHLCVDKNGERIGDYKAELNREEKFDITCNCARDEKSGNFQSFSCEKHGSYQPYTCFPNAKCVCVDQDGEGIVPKELKDRNECNTILENLSEYPSDSAEDFSTDLDYSEYED